MSRTKKTTEPTLDLKPYVVKVGKYYIREGWNKIRDLVGHRPMKLAHAADDARRTEDPEHKEAGEEPRVQLVKKDRHATRYSRTAARELAHKLAPGGLLKGQDVRAVKIKVKNPPLMLWLATDGEVRIAETRHFEEPEAWLCAWNKMSREEAVMVRTGICAKHRTLPDTWHYTPHVAENDPDVLADPLSVTSEGRLLARFSVEVERELDKLRMNDVLDKLGKERHDWKHAGYAPGDSALKVECVTCAKCRATAFRFRGTVRETLELVLAWHGHRPPPGREPECKPTQKENVLDGWSGETGKAQEGAPPAHGADGGPGA